MKRIQLIPLILLLWCSGISLSSGLYYFDIKIVVYLIPIGLMMMVFYVWQFLFRRFARRGVISLGLSLLLSLISMRMLQDTIFPGFVQIFNTVSDKILLSYGIDLGEWTIAGSGSVALAVCQLVAFVTVISLYLYETHRPAVLTALPSFLLFVVSIVADGVPYEMCMIVYAGTLIVFLGMGCRGESVRKCLLLVSCVVFVALITRVLFPWTEIDTTMREYREQIIATGNYRSTKADEQHKKSEKENQKINYGQFSRDGDITYNGTIELYVSALEKFSEDRLYLRGFIGNNYRGNSWFGDDMENRTDSFGNLFHPLNEIHIANAFDKAVYVPYAPKEGMMQVLRGHRSGVSKQNRDEIKNATLKVDSDLKSRIEIEILGSQTYGTIGEAIDIVSRYFDDEFQYTLRPGGLTDGVNEIERFLFGTKRGYCTHYASASVMIFRSMGIPARIAQGYLVSGSRLRNNETVNVLDNNAHAWTEIYVDGEGWIPLDFTTVAEVFEAESGENANVGNGEVQEVTDDEPEEEVQFEEEEPEEEEDLEEDDSGKEDDKKNKKGGKGNETSFWARWGTGEMEPKETFFALLPYGAGVILLVILIFAIIRIHAWRKYLRMKREMAAGSYSDRLLCINNHLERFWKEMGAVWDYLDSMGRTEDIFRRTQSYYIPGTSEEASEIKEQVYQYVLCVYESRYGKDSISEDEYENCLNYLYELISNIRKHVDKKRWKKICKCRMVRLLEQKERKECNERT